MKKSFRVLEMLMILGGVLMSVGCMSMLFGVVIYVSELPTITYINTEALVTDVEVLPIRYFDSDQNGKDLCNLTVKYSILSRKYKSELSKVIGYEKGDIIRIAYNPKNPEEIKRADFLLLEVAILVSVGLLLFIIGVVILLNASSRQKYVGRQMV